MHSDEDVTITEWIEGDTYVSLTPTQTNSAWRYARRYLAALRSVHAASGDFPRLTAWDDAHSLDYLINEVPSSLVAKAYPAVLAAARALSAGRQVLEAQRRQVVHTDLGADNFVFDGNEVRAVLDFTPGWAPEAYALAHFVYWNVLWPTGAADGADSWRPLGGQIDIGAWRLVLIHAALARVIGPALHALPVPPRRLSILTGLLERAGAHP